MGHVSGPMLSVEVAEPVLCVGIIEPTCGRRDRLLARRSKTLGSLHWFEHRHCRTP